jgi:hypothetical protein
MCGEPIAGTGGALGTCEDIFGHSVTSCLFAADNTPHASSYAPFNHFYFLLQFPFHHDHSGMPDNFRSLIAFLLPYSNFKYDKNRRLILRLSFFSKRGSGWGISETHLADLSIAAVGSGSDYCCDLAKPQTDQWRTFLWLQSRQAESVHQHNPGGILKSYITEDLVSISSVPPLVLLSSSVPPLLYMLV